MWYNISMTSKQTLNPTEHTGLWLYDLIMKDLEPDLCSTNIDRLEEIYPEGSESLLDERARMERYEKAFASFETQIASMKDIRLADAKELKKEMQQKIAKKEKTERTEEVSDVESKLEHFDDEA